MSQRPHVVQAVGQLDEDHTDIFGHREEHLPQRLGLLLLLRTRRGCRVNLVTPSTNRVMVGPNFAQVPPASSRYLRGHRGEAGGDRDRIEFEIGQNFCDFKGMLEIRFPGITILAAMRRFGASIGALNAAHISLGM